MRERIFVTIAKRAVKMFVQTMIALLTVGVIVWHIDWVDSVGVALIVAVLTAAVLSVLTSIALTQLNIDAVTVITGPAGPQGAAGPMGVKGEKGDPGQSFTDAPSTWDLGRSQYGNKYLKTRSDGKIFVYSTPSGAQDVTNKEYVDTAVSRAVPKTFMNVEHRTIKDMNDRATIHLSSRGSVVHVLCNDAYNNMTFKLPVEPVSGDFYYPVVDTSTTPLPNARVSVSSTGECKVEKAGSGTVLLSFTYITGATI